MPSLKKSKTEPRPERPRIPGYGISKSKTGMLPWEWAVKTLTESREYWIVTVRPDGRPHAMIIWGLWFDGAFWFGTGSKTQKARNLAKNPNCIVGTQNAAESGDSGRCRRTDHRPSYGEEVRTNIAQQIWNERR
jgi:Pyridoxamine 5'-phosphate oxidase